MKKIISVILCIAMLLGVTSTAFAVDATGIEAKVLEETHIINVTGQFDDIEGKLVTIMLVDNNKNIKHIDEAELESDGTYRAKFKYAGADLADLSLKVKQGNEDVTNTVVSAIASKEALNFQVNIVNAEGKTNLGAKIENFYNVAGKTYTIMLAYYDGNNKLLNTFIQDTKNLEFDTNTVEEEIYDIPEGTEIAKVFVWDNTTTMIPLVDETKVKTKDIAVLMIGNSFTDDAETYLEDIAAADGVNLIVESATYGGGGFKEHWETWTSPYYSQTDAQNAGAKTFRRHYRGVTISGSTEFESDMQDFKYTIEDIIGLHDHYDYVVLSTRGGSVDPDTYAGSYEEECGQNMAKFIREKMPDTEILIYHTWSFEKQSTGYLGPKKYGFGTTFDQDAMWEGVSYIANRNATEWAKLTTESGLPVSLDGKPLKFIPAGQAFNNARKSQYFDTVYPHGYTNQSSANFEFMDSKTTRTLHRDSYHASFGHGRYLLGLVWYGALTGNSVIGNTFAFPKWTNYILTDLDKQILQEAAQKAIDDCGYWN